MGLLMSARRPGLVTAGIEVGARRVDAGQRDDDSVPTDHGGLDRGQGGPTAPPISRESGAAITVQQLIALLATYSPDLCVVVNGYENGFDDVEPGRVSVTRIELDIGKHWWDGRHAAADRAVDEHVGRIVDALVLRRASR